MQDPKPGSREARSQGCRCPVIDNHHGRGRGGDGQQHGWWIAQDCPLHGTPSQPVANLHKDQHR